MAKGLALARVIGLKWPAASDQDAEAGTAAGTLLTPAIIDAEPAGRSAIDPTAAMADALSQALLESAEPGTAMGEAGELATRELVTRELVTNDAITTIEADIASLLASMNAVTADTAGSDEAVDAEEATLALLGELDRLWRADPMVGNANAA